MHIHLGILFGLISFANVLIFGFFWRALAFKFHNTPAGQAMAFVY